MESRACACGQWQSARVRGLLASARLRAWVRHRQQNRCRRRGEAGDWLGEEYDPHVAQPRMCVTRGGVAVAVVCGVRVCWPALAYCGWGGGAVGARACVGGGSQRVSADCSLARAQTHRTAIELVDAIVQIPPLTCIRPNWDCFHTLTRFAVHVAPISSPNI